MNEAGKKDQKSAKLSLISNDEAHIHDTTALSDRDVLAAKVALLLDCHSFAVGDLVKWKDGLQNRLNPDSGQPAIVTRVLAEPVYDSESDSGSPLFREPLTIVVAFMAEDRLRELHLDARRFEPYC
jgi:hypothetical protein